MKDREQSKLPLVGLGTGVGITAAGGYLYHRGSTDKLPDISAVENHAADYIGPKRQELARNEFETLHKKQLDIMRSQAGRDPSVVRDELAKVEEAIGRVGTLVSNPSTGRTDLHIAKEFGEKQYPALFSEWQKAYPEKSKELADYLHLRNKNIGRVTQGKWLMGIGAPLAAYSAYRMLKRPDREKTAEELPIVKFAAEKNTKAHLALKVGLGLDAAALASMSLTPLIARILEDRTKAKYPGASFKTLADLFPDITSKEFEDLRKGGLTALNARVKELHAANKALPEGFRQGMARAGAVRKWGPRIGLGLAIAGLPLVMHGAFKDPEAVAAGNRAVADMKRKHS